MRLTRQLARGQPKALHSPCRPKRRGFQTLEKGRLLAFVTWALSICRFIDANSPALLRFREGRVLSAETLRTSAGHGCWHRSPMALVPLMIRWGFGTSSDMLRRCARCTKCGYKGASLTMPSAHAERGWYPWPRL